MSMRKVLLLRLLCFRSGIRAVSIATVSSPSMCPNSLLARLALIVIKPVEPSTMSSVKTSVLVVLSLNLEVGLRMVADRADVGSLLANDDVATVGTLPDDVAVLREYALLLDIV